MAKLDVVIGDQIGQVRNVDGGVSLRRFARRGDVRKIDRSRKGGRIGSNLKLAPKRVGAGHIDREGGACRCCHQHAGHDSMIEAPSSDASADKLCFKNRIKALSSSQPLPGGFRGFSAKAETLHLDRI